MTLWRTKSNQIKSNQFIFNDKITENEEMCLCASNELGEIVIDSKNNCMETEDSRFGEKTFTSLILNQPTHILLNYLIICGFDSDFSILGGPSLLRFSFGFRRRPCFRK